jgi:hypothetical protein
MTARAEWHRATTRHIGVDEILVPPWQAGGGKRFFSRPQLHHAQIYFRVATSMTKR